VLVILLILLLFVETYIFIKKKGILHPAFWFITPWIFCVLFTLIDYYHVVVTIRDEAYIIVLCGIIGYLIGAFSPVKITLNANKSNYISTYSYRKMWVYIILTLSFIVNAILLLTTISFLRSGIQYGAIRELYFTNGSGYNAAGNGFFASKLLAVINSLISTPFTYVTSIVVIDNFFQRKLSLLYSAFAAIDVLFYIIATGGRLIILLIAVTAIVLAKYYKFVIPKYIIKRMWQIIAVIAIILVVITVRRQTEDYYRYEQISDAYSYFNITIPLLSHWAEKVDALKLHSNGIGFFDGIVQLFDTFVFRRIGITSQTINDFSELISDIQSKKLEVYHLHWYNAYVSLFLYFYADFRYIGVVVGSFIFGFSSKEVYRHAYLLSQTEYILLYVIFIQANFMSFIRWHFGSLSTIIQLIALLLIVKPEREYATQLYVEDVI
jgi:oligosaccharide repeat unit polymerase